jgi:Flp pilus assembly protein TadD
MIARCLLLAACLLTSGCALFMGADGSTEELSAAVPAALPPEGCDPCPPEVRQGLALESAGSWTEALDTYAKAARLDGVCPHGPLGEARVLLATGQPEEAVLVLRSAARSHPGPVLLRALGDALLASGDPNGAYTAYTDALRMLPGDGALRLDSLLALYAAGRHEELASALAAAPVASLPLDVRRAFGRACLLTGRGRRAVEALSSCVDEDPADGTAWLDLARGLFVLGEDDSARFALEKAEQLGADLGALAALRVPAAGGT